MSYCRTCGVHVTDDTESCPLCHSVLELDENIKVTYPDVASKVKKTVVAQRILAFAWVALSLVGFFTEHLLTGRIQYTLVGSLALLYALWMLNLMTRESADYRRRAFGAVAGAVLLVVATDLILGWSGYSIEFVLPGGMIAIDVGLVVLIIVNRRNWASYMILQFVMLLIGIIPCVFIGFDLLNYPIVSESAILLGLLCFLGTLILGGPTAKTELSRRFHM